MVFAHPVGAGGHYEFREVVRGEREGVHAVVSSLHGGESHGLHVSLEACEVQRVVEMT